MKKLLIFPLLCATLLQAGGQPQDSFQSDADFEREFAQKNGRCCVIIG